MQLMARYWLYAGSQYEHLDNTFERLSRFTEDNGFVIAQTALENVTGHLERDPINGDPARWVTFLCFWHHPSAIWDFMMTAFAVAETDDHYQAIATNLVEHLLAHYGSAIPHIETMAQKNDSFARMLTGVWRHRMSDEVWLRLRAIQSRIGDPLPAMILPENGVEYMSDNLSDYDRKTNDKGRYLQSGSGAWKLRSEFRREVNGSD